MKKKMIIIATVPLCFHPLTRGQPRFLSQHFDVKIVMSPGENNDQIALEEGVELKSINMTRKITPWKDLRALWEIIRFFLKEKPDIVYSFTPKAGLLGMIAAFITRVPRRIHWQVGLPLMEATGAKKKLLIKLEWLTYALATKVMANSFGLREYMNKYISKKAITVVGQGSINGVDSGYFHDNFDNQQKVQIRQKYDIATDDKVLIFTGRIVKDKGINELVEAVMGLLPKFPGLKLLLVGVFEQELNPIKPENMEFIKNSPAIRSVGFQTDIRPFLAISDIFVLPSYREGLPNSLIEAGSFGLPLVATDINGCNEIIQDGVNGLLVEMKSSQSLKSGLERLLGDEGLYGKLKSQVRESIQSRFEQKYVWQALKDELSSG